jgi:hypothetical protein
MTFLASEHVRFRGHEQPAVPTGGPVARSGKDSLLSISDLMYLGSGVFDRPWLTTELGTMRWVTVDQSFSHGVSVTGRAR